ncbi:MAG: 3-dehydroquinate synthase [Cyanobacteria bacterium J06627_28]
MTFSYTSAISRLQSDLIDDPKTDSPYEAATPIQQTFSVPYRYDVHFTQNLFQTDNPLLADIVGAEGQRKVLFVVDAGLLSHRPLLGEISVYAQHYAEKIKLSSPPLVVPAGEAAKNDPALVGQLCTLIATTGICRHSYVVAVGGGAVLDLVGYAAAISHRGIRLVRVPTTVLAQNDSGVGVKNGVNAFGKKNFLGTFAPPYAVINDFSFLQSLSDRDWRSGVVEAVKVALIKDGAFFEQIEQDAQAIAHRNSAAMQRLIHRCAQLHVAHIGGYGDPFEQGSSRPLDFGHWAAHRLEHLTDYRLRHGEAVAIGIVLDVLYSQLSGLICAEAAGRILNVLTQIGFVLWVPELSIHLDEPAHPQSLFAGLAEFREHLGGELTIMLLWSIGQGVEVHEVDFERYREVIALMANYAHAQGWEVLPTAAEGEAEGAPKSEEANAETNLTDVVVPQRVGG